MSDYNYDDYVDDVRFKFNLLLPFLKVLFLFIAIIWVFRLGADISASPISFTNLLNYINDCPNFYNDLVNNVLSNVIYTGSTDSINLPVFGGILQFLGNVWNILVYVSGCVVSSLGYLFYFFGIVFV